MTKKKKDLYTDEDKEALLLDLISHDGWKVVIDVLKDDIDIYKSKLLREPNEEIYDWETDDILRALKSQAESFIGLPQAIMDYGKKEKIGYYDNPDPYD